MAGENMHPRNVGTLRGQEWIPVLLRAERFEKDLGLPVGFLEGLLFDGDDWSFVIKLSAVVETALTDYLLRALSQPPLAKEISKMALRTKTAWAKQLGGITGAREQYVQQLSTVRNVLAHQIQKIPTFTLIDYVYRLPNHEYRQLTGYDKPESQTESQLVEGSERFSIWFAAMHVVNDLENSHGRTIEQREQMFQAALKGDLEAVRSVFSNLATEDTGRQSDSKPGGS